MPTVYGKILQVVSGHAVIRRWDSAQNEEPCTADGTISLFSRNFEYKKMSISFLPQQILGLHGSSCFLVYKTVQFIW